MRFVGAERARHLIEKLVGIDPMAQILAAKDLGKLRFQGGENRHPQARVAGQTRLIERSPERRSESGDRVVDRQTIGRAHQSPCCNKFRVVQNPHLWFVPQ